MTNHSTCPDCGQPMKVYSSRPDKPDFPLQAECHNPDCDLYMFTRDVEFWSTATETQLESFRQSGRAIKAIMAR